MKQFNLVALILLITTNLNAQSWSGLSFGTNAGVSVLKEDTVNDVLYAGGAFTNAGVITVDHIAKWDGVNWSSLNGNIEGDVGALEIINGELYVGGMFMQISGNSHWFIAKYDGTNWVNLGFGIGGAVHTITVYNGEIYAGGFDGLKKFNATDSTWGNVGLGITGLNAYVSDLKVYNNELYVAGPFSEAGGLVVNGIAKWDGSNWHALDSGLNEFGFAYALEVYNNELYVGGEYTTAGGLTVNGLARWNGTQWNSVGTSGVFDGTQGRTYVNDMIVKNGELYVGGNFTLIDGHPANNVAKWDGSNFTNLGSGLDGPVFCLESFRGHLISGGDFQSAGGTSTLHIAEWDLPLLVAEKESFTDVTLFPNPTEGVFTVNFENTHQNLTVRVTDNLGRSIYFNHYSQWLGKLDVTLPETNGVYFVQLESDQHKRVFKVMKK